MSTYRLLELGVTHRKFYIIPEDHFIAVNELATNLSRRDVLYFHETIITDKDATIDFIDALHVVHPYKIMISSESRHGSQCRPERIFDEIRVYIKKYDESRLTAKQRR